MNTAIVVLVLILWIAAYRILSSLGQFPWNPERR